MALTMLNHSDRALFTIAGWGLFFAVLYVVATTKNTTTIYDPFEILGISPVCFRLIYDSLCSYSTL